MIWKQEVKDGCTVWTGQTSAMRLAVVPELGSKVISLQNRLTGREWLAQPEGRHGNQGYDSSFGDSDGSGWDEMFPTINPCDYPAFPWAGTPLPDHGEVWSIPWNASADTEKLHCDVHGIRLPYHLRKTYSFIREDLLRIDYSVTNYSPFPFSFLWAAHPLFQIEAGMEIIVPDGLREIAVSYSENARLGRYGDLRSWPQPFADREDIVLNVAGEKRDNTAEKFYFTGKLPEGRAAIYDPRGQEGLTITFPCEKVPYLSIWANYGGYQGQYHLALEPATGYLDHLSAAMEQGRAAIVEAGGTGGTYSWHLEVSWL
ncbi:DUF4432 family protein [Paenibacillus fonticola]|uniref:DUF4432 family protein n=1 Tax=Paenibacillus fonticola TaxID=379896 RepID=UPI00036AF3AE|nr:DUF4432 family protein [Paenibacillus fonticola]